MRTVDPALWGKKVKPALINVTRRQKFGQRRFNGFETRLRASFVDCFKEFWEISSFVGIKYCHNDLTGWAKRIVVSIVLFAAFVGFSLVYVNILRGLSIPPLIINQLSDMNSVDDIHFPAIALCPNNLFSNRRLNNYTEYLVNHPVNANYQFNKEDVITNLLAFGALVTGGRPPFHVNFIEFLKDADPTFNVTDLMFKLAPSCLELLHRCSWRGIVLPCKELFAKRSTELGVCCVFNSRYWPEDYKNPPKTLNLVGQDFGLGVMMKHNRSDEALIRGASHGIEMLVFDGAESPLLLGGAVRRYPLPASVSYFIPVHARVQHSLPDVQSMIEEWRGCALRPGPRSSYSWCLTECLAHTTESLCGCRPFGVTHVASSRPICSLSHLACLHKYSEKFKYLFPGQETSGEPQLREEWQSSLDCEECLPDCDRRIYSADIFYSVRKPKILQNFLSQGLLLTNMTALRIFYMTEHQSVYSVESRQFWYEALAKCSCWLVTLPGVPIVCAWELLYHCTVRWRHHYKRRTQLDKLH